MIVINEEDPIENTEDTTTPTGNATIITVFNNQKSSVRSNISTGSSETTESNTIQISVTPSAPSAPSTQENSIKYNQVTHTRTNTNTKPEEEDEPREPAQEYIQPQEREQPQPTSLSIAGVPKKHSKRSRGRSRTRSKSNPQRTKRLCYECLQTCNERCCESVCRNNICVEHSKFAAATCFITFWRFGAKDYYCLECAKKQKQLSLTICCMLVAVVIIAIVGSILGTMETK